MSLQSSGELEHALTDVRRAYRLVAAYHRRVYDIVDEFVAAFPDREHYWWEPNVSSKPGSADPFRRSSWNMLPMVRASFLFLPTGADPNAPKSSQWMLELLLNTDSGFEAPPKGEPDPETFAVAEQCQTTLRAIAWRPTSNTQLNWLHGLWKQAPWPKEDGEAIETVSPPLLGISQTFQLSRLRDRAAVRSAAAEFKDLASAGLGLQLV